MQDQVLIVDDEPSIRHLVRRWLGNAGYSCAEAENSDAALASMTANPAAVVFCDLKMPGRDGLWLTRQLRAQYPTTAVVLATGMTNVPPNVSMQSGVLAYLIKPFRRYAVIQALQQALQWHEQAVSAGVRDHDANTLDEWLNTIEPQ